VRSALSDGEILGDCDNDGVADSVDNCPSVIPAGATVVSAHATVTEQWNQSVTTVRAHQVVNPWNELTVNWPNFGSTSNFDPTAIASFTTGNDGGPKTFDITALAVDWVSGNADNNGILLEEDLAGTPTLHAYPIYVTYLVVPEGKTSHVETFVDPREDAFGPNGTPESPFRAARSADALPLFVPARAAWWSCRSAAARARRSTLGSR
jgi:hypothetical protein